MKALLAAVGITSFTVILAYGVNWIISCGLFKLVTMCFGWDYNWGIATGIWILFVIAKGIFSFKVTVRK